MRSSIAGATCLTKPTVAPWGVHTRSATSLTARPIERCIISVKSAVISFGLADEPDVAEQAGRDLAQLGDLPVGADAAAVALELPLTLRQDRVELLGRLVLVLAVGEQDRVVDRAGVRGEERVGAAQPLPDRGAAAGLQIVDRVLCGLSRVASDAATSSPFPGYTSRAVSVPATTPKCTPSRMQSIAAAVASSRGADLRSRVVHRAGDVDAG